MATTTPNFGWDIPQSTDLVKDGATAIAALGTDIDTALVDLKGGTTGQVLSKNSNTDLDFTWSSVDPLRYDYKDGEDYHALNPTSQNDTQSDLNKAVNNRVAVDSESAGADWKDYAPPAFGPNYYSQGFALKGIDTYPDWADGFSVVQTEPAKRVVAQGLGFYSLIEADPGLGTDTQKETDAFWVYFPDLELLNPEIAEDLVNNVGAGYKIQCVSPLGYFSEVYNTRKAELDQTRWGADIITYARVIRDKYSTDSTQQINPVLGDDSGLIDDLIHDPAQEYRYPAYGRYTNSSTPDGPQYPGNGNGNFEFTILDVNDITTNSGRQTYLRIQLSQQVYNEIGTSNGTNIFMNANEDGVMEWREPMYVINLIKDVNINPGLTTEYKYTGNYVKFKSLVLESMSSNNCG